MDMRHFSRRKIPFKEVPYNVRFMKQNGQVWIKVNSSKAVKVEHPGAGNYCRMRPGVEVYVDPLDI